MRTRVRLTLAFLLASAASSGCIIGIAEPRDQGADGGEQTGDGAQTADAPIGSDASETSTTHDASSDAGGDGMTQGGDGTVDAPMETTTADAPPDVSTEDAPPVTQYFVFVTAQTYQGDLGGLSGADQKCQGHAAGATPPLIGTFRAWLSDSTASAASHVAPMHGSLQYVMVGGTVVASDWTALTDPTGNSLQSMITRDENGNMIPEGDTSCVDTTTGMSYPGHWVWTDSNDDGTLYDAMQSCQNWTSPLISVNGSTGSSSAMNQGTPYWSSWCHLQSCDSAASLYCIQQ